MSSLQEQLLKAGLVDENKLKQAAKEKNKKGKQVRNSKGKSARNKAPAVKTDAQKRREQQVARDRQLNEKDLQTVETLPSAKKPIVSRGSGHKGLSLDRPSRLQSTKLKKKAHKYGWIGC